MKSGNSAWKLYKYGTINEEQFWRAVIDEHYQTIISNINVLNGFVLSNEENEDQTKHRLGQYFGNYLRNNLRFFESTLQLIQRLNDQISSYPQLEAIAILSNHSKEWCHYIYSEKDNGRVEKLFKNNLLKKSQYCPELIIWSCDVNAAKPEKAIYQLLIDRIKQHVNSQIEPHNICFIDDKDRNVEAATEVGISTIQYDASLPDQYDFTSFEGKLEQFLSQ
ncbi:predicted protein [Naegleria gruberi]|uniref:Predicted protein n=1 Tax=Naegleria gruberi TaxID=5762 RepID=D2VDK0_NAEGR|nr:uncharacterized protein NAEGRDRAFT_66870 [Naegleria gruberi]EFC45154.1 predicted protein [Naegleria gruberi]|eukprot:XP_002677898.1 predicted protein [Naegleria gruberi strain NEG-M]